MHFFISGELDSEVAELFRPVRKEVELLLNQELGNNSYGQDIEKISLIPIILGPRFTDRKERRLLQRKDKAADYRLVIDFEAFLHGGESTRRQLLINNLLLAIADISRKIGGKFEGDRLSHDIKSLFEPLC